MPHSGNLTVNLTGSHGFDFRGLRPLLDDRVVLTDALDASVRVLVDGEPSEETLARLTDLEFLVIPYSGLSGRTRKRLLERPELAVYNLHHNARTVAEVTVALLLAAAKRVVLADRELRRGEWRLRYEDEASTELVGKTALIIGYGAIGRRTAKILHAFDMRVVGIRRGEPTFDGAVEVRSASRLADSLGEADVVVVAVPKTPETTGLLGKKELDRLRSGAIVVNVARGPVIDEKAFFEALRDRRLGAAAIDVWYRYPRDEAQRSSTLPSELPFHELDNVVLSPHRGGTAAETEQLRSEHLARLLNQLAKGEQPSTRVDVQAGY